MKKYSLMVSTGLSCLLLWPAAVRAQDKSDASDGGLQEIVVTAQKRAQNLQDVPIALTASTGEQLSNSGVVSTQQLSAVVPGLTVRATTGSFLPSIRGIGTAATFVENPVSLYMDGVYLPSQREAFRDLVDIEQITVLKGPQGTLFGRNATGGVIQITTKKPSSSFKGSAGVEIDNYATVKGNVYLSGPLADNLASSLTAQYGKQGEGWGTNLTTGHDTYKLDHQFSVRGKVLFTPGPDTSITLIGDFSDQKLFTTSFQPYPGTTYAIPGVGALKSVYDSYSSADTYTAFKGGGLSLSLDQDFRFAKLVSISAWRKGRGQFLLDVVGTPQKAFIASTPDAGNESFSQEVQLVSSGQGPLKWVVGVFYFKNTFTADPIDRAFAGAVFAPNPTSAAFVTQRGKEVAESVAGFGQADWEFLPDTTLTLGARYTYEKRDFAGTNRTITLNNGVVARPPDIISNTKLKEPTFRVALAHKFSPTFLGYASFNTGVKSGGFNVITPTNPPYQPEKLRAYEVGFKSELLDRRLRFNTAAFYYDYSNIQVTVFTAGGSVIQNGAKAKLYGMDIDFEADMGSGFRARGGFAYLHSEFLDYAGATFSTPSPAGGAVITIGNARGKRLPGAQKLSGTVALDYETEVPIGGLAFNLTGNYNGNYFLEPDNFLKQGSYVILNSSVKWIAPNEHYDISLWVRNLLDEKVITQSSTLAAGYTTAYGNPPRTYGVTARVRF